MSGLLTGLFDDAALFPPGDAAMAAAVPAHRRLHRDLGHLVGPFVVPASRLDELSTHLGEGEAIAVSLIAGPAALPAAVAHVLGEPRLVLAAVEVPTTPDAVSATSASAVLADVLPTGVPAAVEIPRTVHREAVLDVLAEAGHRAKLRTGGVRADLFPTSAELGQTLHACTTRGVAFKCTAGLHGALAHVDPPTGFTQHGFLNVLVATGQLVGGSTAADAAELLDVTRGRVLAEAIAGWTAERVALARSAFTSFGTCSVLEPVADLRDLGLLASVDQVPA